MRNRLRRLPAQLGVATRLRRITRRNPVAPERRAILLPKQKVQRTQPTSELGGPDASRAEDLGRPYTCLYPAVHQCPESRLPQQNYIQSSRRLSRLIPLL